MMVRELNPMYAGFNYYALHPTVGQMREQIAHLSIIRPSAIVVIGDARYIHEFAHALPNTLVIARPDGRDNLWQHLTPQGFIDAYGWIAEEYPNVALYVDNEPEPHAASINWLVRVGELCVDRQIKAVLGNYSVGRPEPTDPKTVAADLVRLIGNNRGLLYLGLHEYNDFRKQSLPGGYWFMGRFRFWLDAAKSFGVPEPEIILTEWGADWIRDGDQTVGGAPHDIGVTGEHLHAQYLRAWEQYYAGFEHVIKGACLFCIWGAADPGRKWHKYDHATLPGFTSALMKAPIGYRNTGESPVPITKPTTVARRVRIVNGLRLREEPGLHAAMVGSVSDGDIVELVQGQPPETRDNYTWVAVWYKDDLAWMAQVHPKMLEPIIPPQPEPKPATPIDMTPVVDALNTIENQVGRVREFLESIHSKAG